jgi:D-sedoheptulose 7-phosphate isomerase
MHITGELVGRFLQERRALKAICLSSNAAVLTAWSNDCSYDTVFARQVEAYGGPGGVLLGLSTSGNSTNVILAFEKARELGMTTIALTGRRSPSPDKVAAS